MSNRQKSNSGELSSFGGASVRASRLASSLAPPKAALPVEIDRSCCVPLLALFGGAALWLVVSSALGLMASIKFHAPDFLANCAWLTYGRLQPAADDALLYGFCLPAGLGVALWLLTRLSQTPLRGAVVPIAAANLWHLGVLVGLTAIFIGDSTGFAWLEFPRGGSVPIFFAYLLLALWAMMIFAARRERALYPSQWFLVTALFWFPWIYSTANLFLVARPVRGVAQAVIGWWFADNLLVVWTGLVGLGAAFYFLPKLTGRPLQSLYLALFAFWTFILFATWSGIPPGAPVPVWIPVLSAAATVLFLVPLLVVAIIGWRTVWGSISSRWNNGPFCFVGFGMDSFFLSGLMLVAMACPKLIPMTQFTWFGPAQTQLRLYGFFAMTMFGAVYYLLPRVVGFEFPFPKLVRVHFWLSLSGVALLVVPLALGGVLQGLKLQNPNVAFADTTKAMLPFLRVSTTGLLLLLLGNLLFFANVMGLTLHWKLALLKQFIAFVKSPLEATPARTGNEGREVRA
ncbi:MAG TPA: cbb3-type cytochrome c oxidase subunit I [Candidatus Sulfopaludibacter sp.]|nr:cbb3-type cytochrome c oxidase subunit I [Candidatus Sulfopaludibacter sp.]